MEKKLLIEDILLKMNYDLSKTLTENKDFINEQGSADININRKNQEQLNQSSETIKQQLRPGEVNVSNEYMKVPGHIAIASPGNTYIWIPNESKYRLFSGSKNDFNYMDWSQVKKIPTYEQLITLLKPGTLKSFTTPSGERYFYVPKIHPEFGDLKSAGYKNANGQWYVSPKVEDTRSSWEKFLDEYGLEFQIAGSLIVAILGTVATAGFGAPASMSILMEVLGELAINIPVGIRESQKGENISAGISFLFAVLPLIKTAAGLGKISDEMAKNLSEKLAKQNITNNAEMITFVKTLSKEEQEAMNIMLKQDPKNLIKITEKTLNKEVTDWLKINRKELLGKLPLTKREWAKSLGVDIITTTPLMIYKVFYGKPLSVEDSRKLNGFILSFPKESQEQVVIQLVNNPKLIEQAINNPEETKKYIESLRPKFETGVKMTPQQADSASLSGLEYINNNLDDILGSVPESKK
jgi:hypothetical protein